MVEAVRRLATAAGASCYASPFVPLSWITGGEESLLSRALNWITGYGEETLVSRALSWVTGHSSQAIESEPQPMDQRQPSYTFRELLSRVGPAQRPRPRPALPQRAPQPPRPAPQNFGEPRPARQNFGEQRPTPREPRPAPQTFGQPNFAEPRLASQLRPPPAHPRLIETPRAAPQQVYVPPRPQPQPSGQLQPQAEARQHAKAQLYGEPQPRPLQPAARSARPVFISVPEESQGIPRESADASHLARGTRDRWRRLGASCLHFHPERVGRTPRKSGDDPYSARGVRWRWLGAERGIRGERG